MLDSKVQPLLTGDPKMFWLDNDRVIFEGFPDPARDDTGAPPDSLTGWLGIWDVTKNTIVVYRKNAGALLCYDPSTLRIIYTAWRDKDHLQPLQTFGGTFGREAPTNRRADMGSYESLTCEWKDEVVYPGGVKGQRGYIKLYGNDGFIVTAVRRMNEEQKAYPGYIDVSGRIKVDLSPESSSGLNMERDPTSGAYFLWRDQVLGNDGRIGPVEFGDTLIGWWLYPSGKVQESRIPPRSMIHPENERSRKRIFRQRGTISYHPTALGMFFSAGRGEYVGGYIVRGSAILRVITETIYRIRVSPNGCRAVFERTPVAGVRGTLQTVDFCQGPSETQTHHTKHLSGG